MCLKSWKNPAGLTLVYLFRAKWICLCFMPSQIFPIFDFMRRLEGLRKFIELIGVYYYVSWYAIFEKNIF